MHRHRAFTLVELMVVIAIIGVLIAILIPSLATARETVRRTTCAANLSAIGKGLGTYASNNNDQLPMGGPSGGSWYWDVAPGVGDLMLDVVGSSNNLRPDGARKLFYCPANPAQNADGLWNFALPYYRVLGYSYLGYRAGTFPSDMSKVTNLAGTARRLPPLGFYRRMQGVETHVPGRSDLALDAILSNTRTATYTNNNFTQIYGGYRDPHSSSHLTRGGRPQGANVLCFDSHVEWRDFSPATTFVCGTGTNNPPTGFPYFWFPAP